MTGLLVVHDLGAGGGGEWAEAFAGWPGAVHAPDLPGHGSAPAPVGGHHELGDAAFHLADHLDRDPGVVVGAGRSGHVARMLALGGRAVALVLVDGLGGPWLDVPERNAAVRTMRRRILDAPAAIAPHRPPGTDPRAAMVVPPADRAFVLRACSQVTVPVLAVETPASPTPDADEVLAGFAGDASLVRVEDAEPGTVAGVVTGWWSGRPENPDNQSALR